MKTIFNSKLMFSPAALVATGCLLGALASTQAQVIQPAQATSAVQPITTQVEIGPVLDVVPVVLSDGYTINLTLIPTLTEFDGYDTPPTIPGVTVANVVSVPVILPKLTVRQVISTVNVWDNQTVVLGGGITSTVQTTKDKVPVLGDLPLFGRLFQSQSKSTTKNNLMIFVTATIVDPAGNRVHSDDELPFAQTAIPGQPAAPGQTFQPGSGTQVEE
jgi:general secretion pathway protein D